MINAPLDVVAGASYSVFASDSVSKIAPLVLTDDLTAPAAGKAHIRFIHLSPNAPAVDVALQGGAVAFGNHAFKQFTAFTPLDAGTYNLEVRIAGTTTVVLPLPNIALQAGKIIYRVCQGLCWWNRRPGAWGTDYRQQLIRQLLNAGRCLSGVCIFP